MTTVPSVRVVKSFAFKGGTRLWSNRYHFNGGTPGNTTAWNTLFDAIVAAEKLQFTSAVTITQCVGYGAGSDVPVATKNYAQAGTATLSGTSVRCPGEVAALVRYSTNARSAKNHPIYLFSYYHSVHLNTSQPTDELDNGQQALMNTYANAWLSGFSDGAGHTCVRAGPNGDAATGAAVENLLTHRDFPYTRSL